MVCSSGIGFDPQIDGQRLIFGFEGIWQGTAVMYDQQTRSYWMHLTGACFDGTHEGVVLRRLPTGRHTTWADWRALHPETLVMAPDPRFVGQTTSGGYFSREGARSGSPHFVGPFLETLQDRDPRFRPHDLIYGVVVGDHARAYAFVRLRFVDLVEETVAGVPVAVWFDTAARSAAAFDRRVGAEVLSFERDEAHALRDKGTHSRWTMEGTCVEGELRGVQLPPLHGLMAEWYGWYANHPTTSVWNP